MEVVETLQPGCNVLCVWDSINSPEDVKQYVEKVLERIGASGRVQAENKERLLLSQHGASSFDVILSGILPPACSFHTPDQLAELARILKPGGKFYIREVVTSSQEGVSVQFRSAEKLVSVLKLSGFVDVSQAKPVTLGDPSSLEKLSAPSGSSLVQVDAAKPSYEVGASLPLKLSFPKKAVPAAPGSGAAVWALSATDMVDEEVDLIDSDELLDDADLVKPDPASLSAECDKTQKKKACKNCTCGLAEELAGAQKQTQAKSATSACGSCYLGDAFRCASCPYLGMPAFKPGEKVQLSNTQLNADK